ncbi:hypothetical protein, partial [Parasphingorhabdus sp.]|uniref:hypothetical protein n=1 Tax=Parasphingorhabdus sp. TaxID=2709688 RepID=UPI003001F755
GRLSPTLQSVHAAALEMLDVRYKNSAVIADTKAAIPLPPQLRTFLSQSNFTNCCHSMKGSGTD